MRWVWLMLFFRCCFAGQKPRRQLAGRAVERGEGINLVLVVPGPHLQEVSFDAQRPHHHRDQGKARLVLAQQNALFRIGLFLARTVLRARPATCAGRRRGRDRWADRA